MACIIHQGKVVVQDQNTEPQNWQFVDIQDEQNKDQKDYSEHDDLKKQSSQNKESEYGNWGDDNQQNLWEIKQSAMAKKLQEEVGIAKNVSEEIDTPKKQDIPEKNQEMQKQQEVQKESKVQPVKKKKVLKIENFHQMLKDCQKKEQIVKGIDLYISKKNEDQNCQSINEQSQVLVKIIQVEKETGNYIYTGINPPQFQNIKMQSTKYFSRGLMISFMHLKEKEEAFVEMESYFHYEHDFQIESEERKKLFFYVIVDKVKNPKQAEDLREGETLLKRLQEIKKQGNQFFKQNDFESANRLYLKGYNTAKGCINFNEFKNEKLIADLNEIKILLFQNYGICLIKDQEYENAIEVYNELPQNLWTQKIMYNYAECQYKLKYLQPAKLSYQSCLKIIQDSLEEMKKNPESEKSETEMQQQEKLIKLISEKIKSIGLFQKKNQKQDQKKMKQILE